MPQIDRVLARLDSGAARQIVLEADAPICCVTDTGVHPVSQQVLTSKQVLALVSELVNDEHKALVATGRGIRFLYSWNAQQWLVEQDGSSAHTRVIIIKHVAEPENATSATAPTATAAPVAPSAAPSSPEVRRVRVSDAAFDVPAEGPVARERLETLLREQVRRGAADLHLRVGEPPILRLGGDLIRIEDHPILGEDSVARMVHSIMPAKNAAEFDEQWDTDFAYEIAGVSRFRINVLRDRNGVAAVIRTISTTTVTVEEMGVSPEVQQLCALTKGLVLVTGPTGSGKSTTLCALVDLINRSRHDHIITIEDPIEFVHQSKNCLITQRQVGVHTQSFKSALRAALREDPDIILVGELRDLETIAIALETAETGHLVFATLHTSTAASTINRIIDQFPADRQDQIRVMLSESLKGVVSQTLCKKIGGGRVAAREILLVNKAVSSMIREGKTVQINNVIQTQKKLGMETLNDALTNLVKSKTIEAEEAYVKSVEKKEMAFRLRALGYTLDGLAADE